MSPSKADRERRAELRDSAIAYLRDTLKIVPGDTLYTTHHEPVTYLKVFLVRDGRILNITWDVGRAAGYPLKDKHGEWYVHATDVGQDRGYFLIYRLANVLFTGIEQPADEPQTNCGYWLNHQWL